MPGVGMVPVVAVYVPHKSVIVWVGSVMPRSRMSTTVVTAAKLNWFAHACITYAYGSTVIGVASECRRH